MQSIDYNTQLPPILINEYGRILQNFVNHLLAIPSKEDRTKQAKALVISVISLNPQLKELDECEQVVWDYLHIISDYKLDVDGPYPPPDPEIKLSKPQMLDYPNAGIKFRYYGGNLQNMIDNYLKLENTEFKQQYLDMIGSFMKNSGKNWNDENITTAQIVAHLKTLSKGAIDITEDQINADIELRQRSLNVPNNHFKNKNKNKNNNKRFVKHNNPNNNFSKRR